MIVNPMIVEGQVHGGMAQGVGQALMEHIVSIADGQLLTGSFHGLRHAACRRPAGVLYGLHRHGRRRAIRLASRAAARSGAIGAPAAIGNAVIDALWHRGRARYRLADHRRNRPGRALKPRKRTAA